MVVDNQKLLSDIELMEQKTQQILNELLPTWMGGSGLGGIKGKFTGMKIRGQGWGSWKEYKSKFRVKDSEESLRRWIDTVPQFGTLTQEQINSAISKLNSTMDISLGDVKYRKKDIHTLVDSLAQDVLANRVTKNRYGNNIGQPSPNYPGMSYDMTGGGGGGTNGPYGGQPGANQPPKNNEETIQYYLQSPTKKREKGSKLADEALYDLMDDKILQAKIKRIMKQHARGRVQHSDLASDVFNVWARHLRKQPEPDHGDDNISTPTTGATNPPNTPPSNSPRPANQSSKVSDAFSRLANAGQNRNRT